MGLRNTRKDKNNAARNVGRRQGKGGFWVLALFALPFAAVGIGTLLLGVIPTLYDWGRMQGWQPVMATLESASLHISRGSKSSSYGVAARFRYEVGGQIYVADRVAIGSGSDNVGDFQEKLGRRLERSQRAGVAVPAWVNPSNPREAVLDRSLRPGLLMFKMVFVVLFGGLGAGMLYGAWRGWRNALAAQTPEALAQPWTARREWVGNSIRSNKRYEVWVAWGFTLLCNAIAWPLAFFNRGQALKGPNWGLLALLGVFLLAGAAVLVWAVRATLDARRFGDVRMVLDPFPGAIGGHVGGTLALPIRYQPGLQFVVTLDCLCFYRSRHGGESESRSKSVWQTQGVARIDPQGDGIRLGFRFNVPSGLRQTEAVDSEYHGWRVTVQSTHPAMAFERNFDIPVYATGEQSGTLQPDAAGHPSMAQMHRAAVEQVSQVELTTDGVRLYQPYGRAWKQTIAWMVVGGGFAAMALLTWGQVPGFFTVAFGAVGVALWLGGFYAVANSLTVELDGQGVRTERRLLGLVLIRHQAPARDIARLRVAESYASQTGSKYETFYRVEVVLRNGRKFAIADSLRGRAAADHMLATIASRTGYRK